MCFIRGRGRRGFEEGCVKLGTHRRIRFSDLMKYKKHRDAERERALDEIAQISQEFGMYDE